MDDGYRISVMSRHTLNDGITPDDHITPNTYDAWFKELSPPPKLVGAWYRHEISWEKFEQAYIDYIQSPDPKNKILELTNMVSIITATLLCAEESPKRCHRRLLAEYWKETNPDIELLIE
jgi:uncharacterized protein YeaO (DUF488 family)